ncbi:hypothetical protein [Janthinobacterium sp. CAN_S7]|uniref:hypothetical protein n=1 Tax=Janthinobacterium sp. CAN_S7 TaxID=3071704 RepID=UPI00319E77FB
METVQLKNLAPRLSPAFSPNLYRWLRVRGTGRHQGLVRDTVFRVKPDTGLARSIGAGTLVIGHAYAAYEGDKDVSGIRMIEVLVNGTEAGRFCFAGAADSLEPVADFWTRYTQVGRCAFDPLHQEHFAGGERYALTDGAKTCMWCGAECGMNSN